MSPTRSLAYARSLGSHSSILAFNTDTKPATLEIARSGIPARTGEVNDALGSVASADVDASTIRVTLPGTYAARCLSRISQLALGRPAQSCRSPFIDRSAALVGYGISVLLLNG